MPLPSANPEAFREAEAKLRREGREKAELAKLGPGALELAGLMDRTASFLLAQLPAALKSLTPPGGSITLARSTASGSGGRLAAPLPDLPSPGEVILGAYIVTTFVFEGLIGQARDQAAGSKTETHTTTDEVTVAGNKGTITTTVTMRVTVNRSKVSVDITVKVEGEVRDAATGAFLYRIRIEGTGHADGDVCPDASGTARARMSFGGREDYYHASGARSGPGVIEAFSGELRIKANDNAQLAGVDLTTTGGGGLGFALIELAATSAAPAFEKAWRSGVCIEVLVDPEGGDVEKDSVTDVTAKVKHKIDGNDLDKPVEASLGGVKSIDPAGSKQKPPATFKYTAGSKDDDRGDVTFRSVSNRGIGRLEVTFCVACAEWTISSTGSSNEAFQDVVANRLRVTIKDLKVNAAEDGALTGSGTITLTGPVTTGIPPLLCTGQLDQTIRFTAKGTLVGPRHAPTALAGSGPSAVLRLTLLTETPADGGTVKMTCPIPITGIPGLELPPIPAEGFSDRYGETLGEFDLPADGGTKTISGTAAIGGIMNVTATGTFTVVRGKP